jgi:pimeloyl-ACP methyl ester carboxylesterase
MKHFITTLTFVAVVSAVYAVGASSPKKFFIENKNARMPVVIRGDLASNVLIVFLHGGPGGTAIKKIGAKAFLALEERYAMVYWDQRGSGLSRGGKQRKYLTLDQYTEDLDVLIDKLKKKFPTHDVFLMGHCWGGGYGTAYLIDPVRQAKVSGWIEVAGAHNNPAGDSLSMIWVKKYAMRQIERDRDTAYWKRVLSWYERNPDFTSEKLGHYLFVKKAHGYVHKKSPALGPYPGYGKKDILRTPVKYAGYFLNYYHTLSRFIISDFDFTNEMQIIRIPSLVIWGENDGLIPVAMASNAYNALGTPDEHKFLAIYPKTAHTVFYEQPDLFVHTVDTFIRRYATTSGHQDKKHRNNKTLP